MFRFTIFSIRYFSKKAKINVVSPEEKGPTVMKYLNVAEKNDAAKTIAGLLSNGSAKRREGLSKFNKIYEFTYNVRNSNANIIMTSVSGHLLNYAFASQYKNWQKVNPVSLFDAPVSKRCPEDYVKIKQTLEKEIRGCNGLIIWTDCDREGENIGFEIIEVCRAVKPNISVYRAKFSEITTVAVKRAMANLIDPDEKQSQAVDVRSELDLRIGAAFTRFQTMRFQRLFPNEIEKKLVSYGSCQIPTLGFVAQRFKENENFVPQQFWKIKLTHTIKDLTVDFLWNRNRLFDKQCCEALLQLCEAGRPVQITNVTLKPKSKWRPLPMDTIELEKLGSRKLKMSAKQVMTIAEKLYTKGYISYPRTETNMFSNEMDLKPIVQHQVGHPHWGSFANKVLEWGPNPRKGTKSDQAHPPIHPTKISMGLSDEENRVYELITRHFLACVSKDAAGSETVVNAIIGNEEFTATGLCIHELNYLEVYIYEKWNAKEIHNYQIGQTFEPTELDIKEGTTTAPSMLTEAELIALMDKHGIGTDATHAEHINTIKERDYIGVIDRGFLVPGTLGMGLVEGYDSVDLPLAQPKLRAALEKDLKLICSGQRDPKQVLEEQIKIYRDAFRIITEKAKKLDESMAKRLQATPVDGPEEPQDYPMDSEIFKCPKCSYENSVSLRSINNSHVLSCLGYPQCKNSIWLPSEIVKDVSTTNEDCPNCGNGFKKLKIRLKSMQHLSMLNSRNVVDMDYVSCIVCDVNFQELCRIPKDAVRKVSTATGNRTANTFNSSINSVPVSTTNVRNSVANPSLNTSTYVNPNNRTFSRANNRDNSFSIPNVPPQPRAPNVPRPSSSSSASASNTSVDPVRCPKCNAVAKKLTVRKDSPNFGREFYKCQDQCNFFQWADAVPSAGPSSSSSYSNNHNNNSTWSNRNDGSSSGNNDNRSRAKRKCSVCKREGHTKLKCPTITNNST